MLLLWPLAATAAPPNIVVLLADDLDLASAAFMPEVQALAARGTSFTNAFAVTPMCAPSRATLLTGRYPQNTGVRSNRLPGGGYRPFYLGGQERDTVAVRLRAAGYRTALIGKYINDYPLGAGPMHIPQGWSHWVVPATNGDMHAKYDYTLNDDGETVSHGSAPADYSVDVYAAQARLFIDHAAAAGVPFAVLVTPPSPHVKEVPARRHADLFPTLQAPRPSSFPELDTSDKPPFMRLPLLDAGQIAQIDERYRLRLRMLQAVDEALGGIERLLAERGLLESTYIVFTSDHGWHQGQHNQMPGKGRPYDEDIRVPLIVAGPHVPAGRRLDQLVDLADLAPTLSAWAGAPAGAVDGRSLADLLQSRAAQRAPWRKRIPIMRSIEGATPATTWPAPDRGPEREGYACLAHLPPSARAWPEYRGLRTQRYTYIEHVTGDLELYDDRVDPQQTSNLICRVGADMVAQLHNATEALFACQGDACRRVEDR
ncbi:MAG: sulfatase [Geminicoccaceae bacterium]